MTDPLEGTILPGTSRAEQADSLARDMTACVLGARFDTLPVAMRVRLALWCVDYLAWSGVTIPAGETFCAFTSWGECSDHPGGTPLLCDKRATR